MFSSGHTDVTSCPKPAESGLSEWGEAVQTTVEEKEKPWKASGGLSFLCLRLSLDSRPSLHCGCAASSRWDTCSGTSGELFLSISDNASCVCVLVCLIYLWPFVEDATSHFAPHTCLVFFSVQWRTGDGRFTARLLSVDGFYEAGVFSGSLERRANVPTLQSAWAHVTERHLRQRGSFEDFG